MSLEQAIQENTAAIKELIEVYKNPVVRGVVSGAADAAKPEPVKEKKVAKAKEPEPESVDVVTQDTDDAKPAIEYADVRNVIMSIAKTDRSEAEAVLQRYGVTQISKLKPEQYADVMTFATKVVNGEVSALAGEGDLE